MTDVLSQTTTSAADRRPSVSVLPASSYPHHQIHTEATVVDGNGQDDEGEIACICAYTDDDGNTIQCDQCMKWQHIACYYPPPAPVPDETQKHYCLDCQPRELDARKATERQRKLLDQRNSLNIVKRPAKSHKKKVKDSPTLTAQVNGITSDRHGHLYNHDRKSASPRDQPPPAKRPKTTHRPSNSITNPPNRKRAGTSSNNAQRSPSKSPELNGATVLPYYSTEFLQLYEPQSPQADVDTNIMSNLEISNELSRWLTDSDALSEATKGLSPGEVFKRWDSRLEDIPGTPEVDQEWVEDKRFSPSGVSAKWVRLVVQDQLAPGTLLGELRGRIGKLEHYYQDPDSRWKSLRHPEPCVFFHPQLPICIDARQEGSKFRYVRRSCNPNVELSTIITEGTEYHFCFMAKRDIMPGEELTVAWQIPEIVSEKIKDSLAQSQNFHAGVKDYISEWVSKVLANCGPCACSPQSNCLMAHYDRRGQPIFRRGHKRKLPHLDTLDIGRSRSASEVRKVEQDEDATDSRSVSGSRGSASRDITPNTQYTAAASTAGIPEMSERERKKLQREEEMFRRQAEERDKPKRKRASGGSTLNTPSSSTSKQLGHPTNLHTPKYADASTSRPNLGTSRTSSGRKKAVKTPSKLSPNSVKNTKPTYVDSSTQCELDATGAEVLPHPPRSRKYISATQKLLRMCIADNARAKLASHDPQPPHVESGEASLNEKMDVDEEEAKKPEDPITVAASEITNGQEMDNTPPWSQTEDATEQDISMTETNGHDIVQTEVAPLSVKVEPPTHVRRMPIPPTVSSPQSPILTAKSPHPIVEKQPPSPPRSPQSEAAAMSEVSNQSPVMSQHSGSSHRPVMHVDMPPPPANLFSQSSLSSVISQAGGSAISQSPSQLTPSTAIQFGAQPTPLFSPSVTAAVSASPARKKMSLSDYTKRSRARESTGESTGIAINGVTSDGPGPNASDRPDGATSPALSTVSTASRVPDAAGIGKDTLMKDNGSAITDEVSPAPPPTSSAETTNGINGEPA